jgi:MoaA/NifB/PqqE/SkfB family radical SAM enzyme
VKNFRLPKAVSNELLSIVGNLSKNNMLRAVGIYEKIASIKWHHRGISAIKEMIKNDHPGVEAVRRILKQANPQARSAILNNFILGSLLMGFKKRYAFYEKHQVAPPGTLMISPTKRCNLKCYGCYAATHEPGQELTFDEVDGIISEASIAGTNFVLFLGGEPFMVPWLLDMVEKHTQMAFIIYTNGMLIGGAEIDRLAKMGNAAICIGLDGLKEETDDRKGDGTFDRAMSVMNRLNAAGVVVGFSAMTSRRNFDMLHSDEFYDTMIANGAGFGWIPIAVPQGSACQEDDLIPTQEQKAKIGELIKGIKQRKPILIADFLTDAYVTEGCGAARIIMHVNANGDVEPCVLMPFSVDNIREKGFLEILKSDFFHQIREINQRHCKESQTCMMVYKPGEVLAAINACGAKETSIGTLDKLHEMAKTQS